METEPGWEQNKAHLYAIEHLGSRYSVKQSSASLPDCPRSVQGAEHRATQTLSS